MIIKKEYLIPNMECSMCVLHLEGLQDKLPGIQGIQANLHHQKLVIEYDKCQISEKQILENIEKMGYQVKSEHP